VEPSVVARKVQKADREKIRRDRLNDHFHQLGNVIGTLFNHVWIHSDFHKIQTLQHNPFHSYFNMPLFM